MYQWQPLDASTLRVMDTAKNEHHGDFERIEDARGCVRFHRLASFEIWQGDHIVERSPDAEDLG